MLTPAKTTDKDSSEAEALVKAAVEKTAAHKAPDDIFASIDTDGKGTIGADELLVAMLSRGMEPETISRLFGAL